MALTPEQAATEQHIHEQIDRRDSNALADYAAYVASEISDEHLRNLLLAMLEMDDRVFGFMMAQVRGHSRLMHAALDDLAHDLEKHRAGFMESAAALLMKEAQGEQA